MGLRETWEMFERGVKAGLPELAMGMLDGALSEVRKDGEAFLAASSDKLMRWGDALAGGLLTPEEFKYLVEQEAAAARMPALARIGVNKARITVFRRGLTGLVARSAFLALGK